MIEYVNKQEVIDLVESLLNTDYDMHSAICDTLGLIEAMPSIIKEEEGDLS